MSDAPQPPRRRRLSRQALIVGVAALIAAASGGAALALRLTASAPSGLADVELVATTPASLNSTQQVADVTLTGSKGDVPLLRGSHDTEIADRVADLGAYNVPAGHYFGVSATVGSNRRTVKADITVQSGGGRLLPILLVVQRDSFSVAAGNDAVNHAVLAASGTLIHPPDVTFVDQHGSPVSLQGLRGKVLVAAALDTHCHDTCPLYTAIWSDLQSVVKERGWGDRVAIAEISMDPDRDTPDELLAYGKLTGATWPLLRADVATTFQFWLSVHAHYSKGAAPTPAPTDWYTGQPETYHLDHDSLAVVIDQNGDVRYVLQGNPGLQHALAPALQALLDPAKAEQVQSTPSWSLPDLLDRVDIALNLPLETDRGAEKAARVGSRPPDFTLTSLDGKQVSVSAQLGRPTLVAFWATWCGPCRHDFPALAAAVKAHPGLVVLAVNEGESGAQVRDYMRAVLGGDASRFTALLDGDKSVGAHYLAAELPVTVFVGADGIVQTVRVGQLHDDDLTTGLAALGL